MKTVENGIVTSQNLKLAIKDLQRSGNAFMITKSVKTQRTKKPRKIQEEKRKSSSGRKLIKNMSCDLSQQMKTLDQTNGDKLLKNQKNDCFTKTRITKFRRSVDFLDTQSDNFDTNSKQSDVMETVSSRHKDRKEKLLQRNRSNCALLMSAEKKFVFDGCIDLKIISNRNHDTLEDLKRCPAAFYYNPQSPKDVGSPPGTISEALNDPPSPRFGELSFGDKL